MWTMFGLLVIFTLARMAGASQLVVLSHTVRDGEVVAHVGDEVHLRCLGGSLGWEGDEGRYSESEEEGSVVTSIKIKSAKAGDTGLFTCGSAELGEKVESVYLFVEDPRHLFRDTSPLLVFNVEVQ